MVLLQVLPPTMQCDNRASSVSTMAPLLLVRGYSHLHGLSRVMHVILRLQDEILLVDPFQIELSNWVEGSGKSDHGRGREERI